MSRSRAAFIAFCGLVSGESGPAYAQDPLDSPDVRGEPVAIEGAAAIAYESRHALVIGVSEYESDAFPSLERAAADAESMARVLAADFGFAEENVHLLTRGNATQDALEEALEDWVASPSRVGPHDLVVVYFAGHGVTRDLGERGQRGYLVPTDGRANPDGTPVWGSLISMNDLEDVSEAIPAKHVLFVLDCCFSGLAIDRSPLRVAPGLSGRARQVLTAGAADQAVLDSGGNDGHSVFTGALLDGLGGKADVDGDDVLTFGELAFYVTRDVERKTGHRQTPRRSTFPDDEGGCVALFGPDVVPGGATAQERLQRLERTADQQLAELRRLQDVILVEDLRDQKEEAWPETPAAVAALRAWLLIADELVSRRPLHRSSVQLVRQEVYLQRVLAGRLRDGEVAEPTWEDADPYQRWRFETFSGLVRGIDDIANSTEGIRRRLAFAESVEEMTVTDPKVSTLWADARRAIRGHPAYDGLDLPPQVGLVPLDADPDSTLWEFAQLRTGSIPVRDPDTQRLVITDATGLVFVLIPGGTYLLGSQKDDPQAPNYDAGTGLEESVHSVTLTPFLLSKYEMTQGQWTRFTGENPSWWEISYASSRNPSFPIDNVSWTMCRQTLWRLGLELPTEAQWEAACRAGRGTPWHSGDEIGSLARVANLADRSYVDLLDHADAESFDDGNGPPAAVGSYLPNAFGLHDMHGNVWEWCRDAYGSYSMTARADDGLREPRHAAYRVYRGGSYFDRSINARSAFRNRSDPGFRNNYLGCRPTRPLR